MHEPDLTAQLQADVQQGVRADLDLWPAIRGQVRAQQAAARPRPAYSRRPAVLAGGLLLAVGLLVATLALLAGPHPALTPQTVTVTRQIVVTDPRLAQILQPPIVSNAAPAMHPPVQTLVLTFAVTLEQVILTADEVQATLQLALSPADSPAAAWAWTPEVTLRAPTSRELGTAPPQLLGGGRWLVRFPLAGLPKEQAWTLTVTRLIAPAQPGGGVPGDLAGPWTFTLPDRLTP